MYILKLILNVRIETQQTLVAYLVI